MFPGLKNVRGTFCYNWASANEGVNSSKCYFFLWRCVFWKRYQNMMSDQLKHFVVMIKLSSNYFLLVVHEIAE